MPLYNEARNVQPLARKIFEAFREEKRAIELILVDDRSTDETWQEILAARRADSRVRALRHRTQSGQSAALWTGFQASRGEVIATLDGDLQNDPADLPRMLAQLAACDMVCGVRVGRKDTASAAFHPSSRVGPGRSCWGLISATAAATCGSSNGPS